MDQGSMVGKNLTEEMISSGEALIVKLGDCKIRLDAALWYYFADTGVWKLLISAPKLSGMGPRAAYGRVRKVLSDHQNEIPGISLGDIRILRKNAPILATMRVALRTGSELSRIRFSQNVVNGTLITDSLVYRLM
jgi:hypothetical protein